MNSNSNQHLWILIAVIEKDHALRMCKQYKLNNFTRVLTGRMSSQVRYFVVIEQREDNAQRGNRKGCPKRQQDAWKVHVHATYAIKGSNRFHADVKPFVVC